MPDRIYWDSSVFLAVLQNETGRVAACRDTMESARKVPFVIFTSAFTLTEVLWLKKGPPLPKDKALTLNKFFRKSCFRVVNLNRKIAEGAQMLVWENKIRPRDSIHAATAQTYRCSALETFDAGLIAKGRTLQGMEVREPEPAQQGALDL